MTIKVNNHCIINVHNISKSFNGKIAVNQVSLQVKKGEIFGFLGPNGSGKTTTIRMICGLLIPDSGQGTCMGYDILKESYLIKKQVGYMTQRFSLYEDLTVYENLDFVARIHHVKQRKKRIEESLKALGLSSQRQNQLAGQLSGGWKQRLALAAATIHQPQVLLLDEPTAGVDPKARREFWDEIHQLSDKGITTLVSTHYMDEAERCHRLAYIAYGQIITHGTLAEVIDSSDLSTWEVTGDNLQSLAIELRQLKAVQQVTIFGQRLHVSATNAEALEHAIKPFQTSNFHWRKITSNLEDVFIHFISYAKDNFT